MVTKNLLLYSALSRKFLYFRRYISILFITGTKLTLFTPALLQALWKIHRRWRGDDRHQKLYAQYKELDRNSQEVETLRYDVGASCMIGIFGI